MAATQDGSDVLHFDELEIRLGEGLVLATGEPLLLSVREFQLLAAMARRLGAVLKREQLYDLVWGAKLRSGDRSVDVYVSKLRSKLETALPQRRFIHTHPGFGYRFAPQPAPGVETGEGEVLSRDVHTHWRVTKHTARGNSSQWRVLARDR